MVMNMNISKFRIAICLLMVMSASNTCIGLDSSFKRPDSDGLSRLAAPFGEYTATGYHEYLVYNICQNSLSRNHEARARVIFYNLRVLRSDEAQLLRLVLWIREEDSDIRKELITQYLSECDKDVEKSELTDFCGATMNSFKDESADERMREIDLVYETIHESKASRTKESRLSIDSDNDHGIIPNGPLARLARSYDERGLHVYISDQHERRLRLSQLPFPAIDVSGDLKSFLVFSALWLTESEASIRQGVIMPRLVYCLGVDPRVPNEELAHYFKFMKQSSVDKRKAEMKRYGSILKELCE
jgi:hypothetical protein